MRNAAGQFATVGYSDDLRHCSACERDLPLGAFSPRPDRPRGCQSRCKECARPAARAAMAVKRSTTAGRERLNAQWMAWLDTSAGRVYLALRRMGRRGHRVDMATAGFAAVVLARDPCAYCPAGGGSIDHIDSLARGGGSESENLTGACGGCNRRKSDLPLLGFMLRRLEVAV